MNKTVYKVVAKDGIGQVYNSCVIRKDNPLRVEYIVGEVSYPSEVVKSSKLFAFLSLDDAELFAIRMTQADHMPRYIFEAKSNNIKTTMIICSRISTWRRIVDFWGGNKVNYTMSPPPGTVVCDSMELVKMVSRTEPDWNRRVSIIKETQL